MRSKTEFPLLAKIINGSIAGVIGVSSIFPLDVVKTRLQNQRIGPNGETLYKNVTDCFKKIYRAEGVRGLYRGVALTVAFSTPEKMFKLTMNDLLRHYFTKADGSLSLPRQMAAGGLTGMAQVLITTPLELAKINLQISSLNDKAQAKKTTARSIFGNLIREKGVLGLYKGICPTLMRDGLFSLIFFPLFAAITDLGPRNPDGKAPPWCSLSAGFAAGSFSAFSVTPADVIKTRIQASIKKIGNHHTCISMLDCIRQTYAKEGIKAFYKGGLCRMMVIAPMYGIAQCIYFLGVGEKIVDFFSF